MKQTKMVRQGDVLLIRVKAPKAEAIENAPTDARGVVLAEGESSGHHHAVFGGGAKLFRFRDTGNTAQVLTVAKEGAELRVVGGGGAVPRHTPIRISGGTYEVRTQRQWTAEDERSQAVQD